MQKWFIFMRNKIHLRATLVIKELESIIKTNELKQNGWGRKYMEIECLKVWSNFRVKPKVIWFKICRWHASNLTIATWGKHIAEHFDRGFKKSVLSTVWSPRNARGDHKVQNQE